MANIIKIGYVQSNENFADVLTKPLGGTRLFELTQPILLRHQYEMLRKKGEYCGKRNAKRVKADATTNQSDLDRGE